jgi:hypothetical protein
VTEHLARHQLEELIAEDPRASTLRAHVASCDHCAARQRTLTAAKARYLAALPALDFARSVIAQAERSEPAVRTRSRTWKQPLVYAPALGLLALAAVAMLWIAGAPGGSEIRMKGSASLWTVAKHGSTQSVLRDGDALVPGDQIAFEYALDRPRFLLLLGIDDAGAVTRYFPGAEPRADRLAAATRTQLPIGIELDARKGEERLYALFSEEPLDEVQARNALERALNPIGGGAVGRIARMGELDLPAIQRSIWFRKP